MADTTSAIEITTAEKPHQNISRALSSDSLVVKGDESREVILSNKLEQGSPNLVGSDVEIGSSSGLSDANSTPTATSFEQTPQSDQNKAGSPIQYNAVQSSTNDLIRSEIIDVPVFQKDGKTIIILLTLPTQAIIRTITGVTNDSSDTRIEYQVASNYGSKVGSPFTNQTKFLPGDYSLGLVFRSLDEANKVVSIKINIILEPISALMLSQIIFGLYRSLGFEPSHVLKYPVKSEEAGIPFYRKTRGEIGKVVESVAHLSSKVTEQTSQLAAKIDGLPIHKLGEITSIVSNTAVLLNSVESKTGDLGTQLIQVDSKIHSMETLTNEINSKVGLLGNSISEVGTRVDRVSEIGQKVIEVGSKVDKLAEIVNPLCSVQDKLKEMAHYLSKGSVNEDVMKHLNEVQLQLSRVQEQLNTVQHSNHDVEKGTHEIQSITVSDFEKLLEEKDTFFNKLVEAEEHIEYLQEQIDEMEKARERASTSRMSHKPNFVRRNPANSEWS